MSEELSNQNEGQRRRRTPFTETPAWGSLVGRMRGVAETRDFGFVGEPPMTDKRRSAVVADIAAISGVPRAEDAGGYEQYPGTH